MEMKFLNEASVNFSGANFLSKTLYYEHYLLTITFFVSQEKGYMIIVLQVVNEPANVQCPVVEMSTRSKLSCLSWNKYTKNHIASSDYEGIVTVWDVTTRQVLSKADNLSACFPLVVQKCGHA